MRQDNKLLTLNPQQSWLRKNPEQNAYLSIFGQAKILSLEAYNKARALIKELDISEDALADFLPPKDIVEPYFKFQETSEKFGNMSWEAKLELANNDKLREYLNRTVDDTPVKALELKVENRDLFDMIDSFSNKESPKYIADEKDRAEAIKKLKTANPVFVDDLHRIEAIEKDADDKTVEAWVERGRISGENPGVNAEEKLWLVDNPEIHKWALEKELLTDDGKDWIIPALRIDAKYRKQDAEYDALPTEGSARSDYLAKNAGYRMDRRRREAYQLKFPPTEVENFVNYNEMPVKGYRKERFLLDSPEFGEAMHTLKGIDLPEKDKVPSVRWDEIYEGNQKNFDKLWGLSDFNSEFYIEDVNQRARERDSLLFKDGRITTFGRLNLELQAYGKFVPDGYVDSYAKYYAIIGQGKPANYEIRNRTELWYEDDWFLMENQDFYKDVYVKQFDNERKDFRTVPTREVFKRYLDYQWLSTSGNDRDDFRRENREFDEWLVLKFGYRPITEKKLTVPKPLSKEKTEIRDLQKKLSESLK